MAAREVRTETLPNGLVVIGEVIPSSQSAAIGYFVKTGSRDETPEESGVSHFLEHMMFKGTAKRSSMDITYELGNMGAQSNAFTSEEQTVYYGAVIPEFFGQLQALLSDMLRPALVQAEFDTEKKVILEEIALYEDRPHFFLYERGLREYFGEHPVGNSVLGTQATVGALTRDQMAEYFNRRYAPTNIVLSAAGNFSWDKFISDASELTASWSNIPVQRSYPNVKAKGGERTWKKKDLQQAHVMFLAPCCSAQEEDRYPMSVLASILGDSSGSKLYWELIDTGLAESVGADSDERDKIGAFMVSASTEPANLPKVEEILTRVLSKPMEFTDAELEQAKTKIKTRVVLGGELPMGRMMALGQEWNYRKRLHSLSELIEKLSAVNRTQIEDALSRYPLTNWSRYRLVPE